MHLFRRYCTLVFRGLEIWRNLCSSSHTTRFWCYSLLLLFLSVTTNDVIDIRLIKIAHYYRFIVCYYIKGFLVKSKLRSSGGYHSTTRCVFLRWLDFSFHFFLRWALQYCIETLKYWCLSNILYLLGWETFLGSLFFYLWCHIWFIDAFRYLFILLIIVQVWIFFVWWLAFLRSWWRIVWFLIFFFLLF
jgi:hypothetical protein